MSKARVTQLGVSTSNAGSKARVTQLGVSVPAPTGSKARVSRLGITSSGALSRARVSQLHVNAAGSASATRWIMRGGALLPLGVDASTPIFPTWGPYGDLGTYEPAETTSGADWPEGSPPNGTLTGDQTITTAGRLIDGMAINGRVLIQAANVTLRNCRIYGSNSPTMTSGGVVQCSSQACVNAIIEDCTIIPTYPNGAWDGIRGHDFTARRNRIEGICDGFGIDNNSANLAGQTNVKIQACLVGPMGYRESLTQPDGHTHNDGIQFHNCNGVEVVGNKFRGFVDPLTSTIASPYASQGGQVTGQAILLQPQTGDEKNVLIQQNWFSGWGESGVHMAPNNVTVGGVTRAGLVDNIDIYNNRWYANGAPLGVARVSSNNLYNTVRVKVSTTITNVDCPLTGPNANLYLSGTPITMTT